MGTSGSWDAVQRGKVTVFRRICVFGGSGKGYRGSLESDTVMATVGLAIANRKCQPGIPTGSSERFLETKAGRGSKAGGAGNLREAEEASAGIDLGRRIRGVHGVGVGAQGYPEGFGGSGALGGRGALAAGAFGGDGGGDAEVLF